MHLRPCIIIGTRVLSNIYLTLFRVNNFLFDFKAEYVELNLLET